jgi:arylformamidase
MARLILTLAAAQSKASLFAATAGAAGCKVRHNGRQTGARMISDWDDAYDSAAHIADAEIFPRLWAARAASFEADGLAAGRAELDCAYGESLRERLDLFFPHGPLKGLVVYVHGGDWIRFDKSSSSHFAEGAVRRGWAVAVPSHELAPAARIRDIAQAIARAIAYAAARVPGPIALTGHGSGGHLVARMACLDGPLAAAERARLARVAPISGLFDLRPLMRTRMNATLRLDEAEAVAESPALTRPLPGLHLTAWVGGDERPEFIRQSELIANIWTGLGAAAKCVRLSGRHHYDVMADLCDSESQLTAFVAP